MRNFYKKLLRPENRRLIASRLVTFICLAGIAYAVTAQFLHLNYLPKTPADDLARHVAMAENFFAALASGQIVPIIQSSPFLDLPDLPVFQYYGFMTGLAALPGMLFSLPTLKALMLGILIFRLVGAAGIYWAAKLLGGNRKVSILAALMFYLTPYLISNLYGRVAVPETLAHCELPFLIVGLLLGFRGHLIAGTIVIAITVVFLSLTHPIFLLYGCLAVVLMMSVSSSKQMITTGVAGLTTGTLLSAFRWYPVFLTRDQLARFENFVSPDANAVLTSWSGLFGFPKSVLEITQPQFLGTVDIGYLYLSPGWFTLPAIFGLIVLLFVNRKENVVKNLIILIPGIVFLILAFGLGLYKFLPNIMWSVQFPYRLLSFVGLFTALALPILFPRLKTVSFFVLTFLTILQSVFLLIKPTYLEPLDVPSNSIARTYALYDYSIVEKNTANGGDNWMFDYSKNFLLSSDPPRPLSQDNLIPELLSTATEQFIRVTGEANTSKEKFDIWLEDPKDPLTKSSVQRISPGTFEIIFSLPKPNIVYRLVTDPKLVSTEEANGTIIYLKRVDGIPFHFLKKTDAKNKPIELRLSGRSIFTDEAIEIWLAKPSNPQLPVTGKISIPPGVFSVSIPYPDDSSDYILVPSKTRVPAEWDPSSSDRRQLSLDLKYAEIVPVDMPHQPRITYEFVDTKQIGAYSRLYSIRKNAWWTPEGVTHQPGTVELPLAYSPFYVITQNGETLVSRPDEKARTNVITNDLTHEIRASYQIPYVCYIFMAAGILFLIIFSGYVKKYMQ
jgi:hypothetical protein